MRPVLGALLARYENPRIAKSSYNHCAVPTSAMKRIICLANSGKNSERCIAGKETKGGGSWIRPVGDRESGEVTLRDRRYEDGSEPQLLDIIEISLLGAQPDGCQRENWLLDPRYYWDRAGRFPRSDLDKLLDPVERLWVDGSSTRNGLNDRVPKRAASTLTSSLRFIRVDELVVSVFAPSTDCRYRKRKVQGQFHHAGTPYKLSVTDPIVKETYLNQGNGRYKLGACYMTISLGEIYHGARYKLIAAIIRAAGALA